MGKRKNIIPGKKVKLIPLKRKDIELLRQWRNKNRDFFFNASFISKFQQVKWFRNYQKKDDDFVFIIETLEGRPIGTVSLYDVDLKKGNAEYGRTMIGDEEYRRRGFAKDATVSLLSFAFSNLKLNEIRLEVLKKNKAAASLYKKLGFELIKDRKAHPGAIAMMLKKKV